MTKYRVFLMNGQQKPISDDDVDTFKCDEGWIVFLKNGHEYIRFNGGTVAMVETVREEKSDSKIITLG